MTCSLIKPEAGESGRFSYVLKKWEELAAGKRMTYDNTVFLSERGTADTNHALAYLMKSKGSFPEKTDITQTLEFYFQCCSLQSDTETMAIVAATLANGGINPMSGK